MSFINDGKPVDAGKSQELLDGAKTVEPGVAVPEAADVNPDKGNGEAASEGRLDTVRKDEASELTRRPEENVLSILERPDDEVVAELMKDAGLAKRFQAANQQKSMANAAERKTLEQERDSLSRMLEQVMTRISGLENRFMQAGEAQRGVQQPAKGEFDFLTEGTENDPMMARVAGLSNQVKMLQDSLGMMQFGNELQTAHVNLKARYADYDPAVIQETINRLDTAGLQEVVYKALKFNSIDTGAIEQAAYEKGMRDMLSKMRSLKKESEKVAVPVSKTTTGGQDVKAKAKNMADAAVNGVKAMRAHGQSFFKE
jgi:hypothetical protein